MTTSPTARALATLEAIQQRPGITADQLAEELEISNRAARRYVATLRASGVRIDAARGPAGGYRIGRGLRLPPLTFSAAEALALVMAVLDGHHDADDPDDAAAAALAKILRGLPTAVAAQADAVRRAAAPAPDRSAARPDPATTATLVEASTARRRARIQYRSELGNERSIEVEPWAVVVRHGRWYLLCRSVSADATRAYRVDRIADVAVLDATFDPPAELDPVADLEAHLASGWEYEVEVHVDAPIDDVARCLPAALGRLEAVDATATRLVGTTSNPRWYAEQLAALRSSYVIVRGDELRDAAGDVGRRLVAAAATRGRG